VCLYLFLSLFKTPVDGGPNGRHFPFFSSIRTPPPLPPPHLRSHQLDRSSIVPFFLSFSPHRLMMKKRTRFPPPPLRKSRFHARMGLARPLCWKMSSPPLHAPPPPDQLIYGLREALKCRTSSPPSFLRSRRRTRLGLSLSSPPLSSMSWSRREQR